MEIKSRVSKYQQSDYPKSKESLQVQLYKWGLLFIDSDKIQNYNSVSY